ncbi:HIT domain-containing protein [Desulfosediminicola ganghwensis]|uniref:HIT domain-containing protein n=1 Tax=Desulfosediminicola ganghwensis TaxID=2569540 RepID=UPI001C3E4278|nr:HIT domain-containing protein [Desulfosediminicola ganghwensis]
MNFGDIYSFITEKMRMSHIYQPVMLMELLERRGTCHQADIAKAILNHDESQIEYYTKITNQMVGKVLRKHQIVKKDGPIYSINGYSSLSPLEVEKIILACQERIIQFIEKRQDSVWEHRRRGREAISGTIRYEVYKRAKFRCELCGTSADEKALEIDHIIPSIKGGPDDISNYQALCYSCNAMKRDRDDTDFRGIRESYKRREEGCLFCSPKDIIDENRLCYAMRDGYPVTPLHTLIIPKRHISSYFDLGQAEMNAITDLIKKQKVSLETLDETITGFNVGINDGTSAGQTIFHCHIHLIPRRDGDVESPRGGVRHTIPGKGDYPGVSRDTRGDL